MIGSCHQTLFFCSTLNGRRKDHVSYNNAKYCAKEPSERQYSYCSCTSTRILFGRRKEKGDAPRFMNETKLMTLLQPRKSARPNPVVRFFDIERLLRTIDDDDLDNKGNVNYDESDDEENVVLLEKGEDPKSPAGVIIPNPSLPLDDDEDINTAAEELTELLADGPAKKTKLIISATNGITNDDGGDDVDEGDYGLGTWAQGKFRGSRAYVNW